MITARLTTFIAASVLTGVAFAQNPAAPAAAPAPGYNTSSPSSASSPPQRAVTSTPANEAPPNQNPGPTAAASPHQTHTLRMAEAGRSWTNMSVRSPSGRSLGTVANVIPGLNGRKSSGYVVVTDTHGMSTPVPYRTASSMVRHDALVLGRSRFEHAPKVTQEDLQNTADKAWRVKADRYWMRARHSPRSH